MGKPLLTVSSITRAMRARELLQRHGIEASVERVPHSPGMGCGYGVFVPARTQEALYLVHGVHACMDRTADLALRDLLAAADNHIIIRARLERSQMIGLITNWTHQPFSPSATKNRAFATISAGTFIVRIAVRS